MAIADINQVIQSQSQRMQTFYQRRREFDQQELKLLNQDLLSILPNALYLTWENYQEFDDNGYFNDVRDVVLHLDHDIRVDFGCHSDIQNQEWEYIDVLSEPTEDTNAIIAHFAKACESPHIQTEQQVKLILQTIGSLVDVALTANSDSVTHLINDVVEEVVSET